MTFWHDPHPLPAQSFIYCGTTKTDKGDNSTKKSAQESKAKENEDDDDDTDDDHGNLRGSA